ncbi:MAG: SAM-dependent methyltransferase [Deltaproteobacteria bacterium]|nr:SAM-dependent methyltransferase [Deltaproteobacteria bacterium]
MNNLTEIIKSRIRDFGPITFAEFMEFALYHTDYGYYSSGNSRIGKEGDFYTSPHVHKSFGSVIGNFIIKSFDLIQQESLSIIELGAGKGVLALDILNHIKINNPKQYAQTTYYLAEQSNYSQNESKKTLSGHSNKIKWLSSLDEVESGKVAGVVISNELLDALPFHRLKITNGNLTETFVTLEDGDLAETTDKPSVPELGKYFSGIDMNFREDQEFEVNLRAEKILKEIDRVLQKGFVITIDYGYLNSELFSPERMKGTYKCIHKHSINETPYINIGEQDITAHVDFSNLIRAGVSFNINKVKYTTQGQFLIDWGILDLISSDLEESGKLKDSSAKEIQAIKNLFLPELMGDKFKVLIQEKNLRTKSNDFYPQSPLKISFNVL